MNTVRRIPDTLILATACLVVLAAAGCGKQAAPPAGPGADLSQAKDLFTRPVAAPQVAPTTVVAIVAGEPLRRSDVETEAAKMTDIARRRLPPERLAQMQDRFLSQALDNLIVKSLLMKAVDAEQIAVAEEDRTNAMARFQAALPAGATLEQILERNQWTREEFDKNLDLDVRINKLLEKHTGEIPESTEEEIQKVYDENKERFFVPESVSAKHILIAIAESDTPEDKAAKKARADEVHQKLVAGGDFAALATEYSDCPSKARGGDLGTFTKGQMVKPFEDAAFSQKPGEIGPVVETQFGFHVIQVQEHKDAHTLGIAEVHDQLARGLKNQKQQAAVRNYIEKLKADANIVFPEGSGIQPTPSAPPAAAEPVGEPTAN